MKKSLCITLAAVLLLPSFAYAQVTPAGQTWIDSLGIPGLSVNPTNNAAYNAIMASQPQQPSTFCSGQTCTYVPLEPLTPFEQQYTGIGPYLQSAFRILITLGALLAVTMLVVSGIRYMLSESFTDKGKARARINASLLGLLLLVSSWLIINVINPNLKNFNIFNLGSIPIVNKQQNAPANAVGVQEWQLNGFFAGDSMTKELRDALGCSEYNFTTYCVSTRLANGETPGFITFDPTTTADPSVKDAIDKFTKNCEASNQDTSLVTTLYTARAKTVDGALVNQPGKSAMFCALN